MPGSPSKTFELEIASLWPKETQGVPGQQIAPGLKPFLEPQRWEPLLNQAVVPLGLRWRVTPNMGLPRAPFSVWRRHRKHGDPTDVNFDPSQVNTFHIGKGAYHVPTAPLYVLLVTVANNSAQPLRVQALDTANNPLLLQLVNVPPNRTRISALSAPLHRRVRLPGFQRGQERRGRHHEGMDRAQRGMGADGPLGCRPRKANQAATMRHFRATHSQLKDPRDAAADRLNIAQQFYLPLATTLPSGVQVPSWETPDPMRRSKSYAVARPRWCNGSTRCCATWTARRLVRRVSIAPM